MESDHAIEDCQNYARKYGFNVFAVKDNLQCFTADDAETTFSKHGPASQCKDGRGGPGTLTVYKVACQVEGNFDWLLPAKRRERRAEPGKGD